MPDVRDFPHAPDHADPLLVALRGLPAHAPAHDDWPRLAAALHRRVSPRSRHWTHRRRWPLAAAAVLVAALLLPWPAAVPPEQVDRGQVEYTATATPAGDASDGTDLVALIARSQWLEQLVAEEALTPVAYDADQLLIDQALRDRIGHIDLVLAGGTDADPSGLWQARVDALTQLAGVQWAARQGGLSGSHAEPMPAATLRWAN